jgi:hypothetical protein
MVPVPVFESNLNVLTYQLSDLDGWQTLEFLAPRIGLQQEDLQDLLGLLDHDPLAVIEIQTSLLDLGSPTWHSCDARVVIFSDKDFDKSTIGAFILARAGVAGYALFEIWTHPASINK